MTKIAIIFGPPSNFVYGPVHKKYCNDKWSGPYFCILGISMIYTLIEYAKENQADLTKSQLEREEKEVKEVEVLEKKVKEKKEHMTKKQKSKLQDRMVDGELPRGWDWVCLIRHLSQVGTEDQRGTPIK